jgi:cell division septation protein DedD
MSKITKALERAEQERNDVISPAVERDKFLTGNSMEGKMKKSWMMWAVIAVAVVAVFVVFNYQGGKDAVPLSEIFPDEEVLPANVEYEFVKEGAVSGAVEKKPMVAPIQEAPPIVEKAQPVDQKPRPSQPTEKIEKSLAASSMPTDIEGAYTIQIASFKDKKLAEEALGKIKAKVPSAYIASRDLGEKGVWYRVYAGQFRARTDAEVLLSNIKQNYDGSFIISPKKSK